LLILESVLSSAVSGGGDASKWEPVEIEDELLVGFAMTGSVMTVLELSGASMGLSGY